MTWLDHVPFVVDDFGALVEAPFVWPFRFSE
jgi:hypothetical protein